MLHFQGRCGVLADAPQNDPVQYVHRVERSRWRRRPMEGRQQHAQTRVVRLLSERLDPDQRFGLGETAFRNRAVDGQQCVFHDSNPSSAASSADMSFLEMLSSSS